MKKKSLSLMVTLCLLFSSFSVPVSAATVYTDMPDGAYGTALQKAVDNGLIQGDGGRILPEDPLTRAQMAAIVSRAFGASEKADITAFRDVTKDSWYYGYLQSAVAMGVLSGSGTALFPEKYITREEAFSVIGRALKLTPAETATQQFADQGNISPWAAGSVYAMINEGYVNGDGVNIRPKDTITRQEFAVIFNQVIAAYIQEAGTVETAADGNLMINAAGVTLKNLTVNGDLIIGEGVGDGEVILDNVEVTGRLVVRGGGENSIHIRNNSRIGSLVISKTDSGAVRVVSETGSTVEFTFVDDGKDDVILEGAFESVSVESNVSVVARDAEIATMKISGESASVKIDGTSVVAKMEIAESAKASAVEISEKAKITKVESSAEGVSISGSGKVTEAVVNGNNTTVSTSGTKVTVSEGVSGTSQTSPAAGGGSGSGGNGGSHSQEVEVSSFTALQNAMSNANASSVSVIDDFAITADITLSKPVTVEPGVTITNNAILTVNDTFELGAAALTNQGAGEITVGTGAAVNVYMSDLLNNGTFTVAQGGRLELDRGGIFENTGALVNNGTLYIGIEGGSLNLSGGTATNTGTIINYSFINGTLTANTGTIENHFCNATSSAIFTAALADANIAHIYIGDSASITLTTDSPFTKKVEIDDGALTINANVAINTDDGYLAIDGPGSVVVSDGKTITVSAAGRIGINGELEVHGALANNGEINIVENGVLYLEGGSVTNASGATLTNDDGDIRLFSGATLANSGKLQQDGGLILVDVFESGGCTATPCAISGTFLNNAHCGYIAEVNDSDELAGRFDGHYTTVNLNVNTTLADDLSIPAAVEFSVAVNAVLTVPTGTAIEVLGELAIDDNAELIIDAGGGLDDENIVSIFGTLTNNGLTHVGPGSMLDLYSGGTIAGTGTMDALASGSDPVGAAIVSGYYGVFVFDQFDTITLLKEIAVPADDALTIESGKELVIAPGQSLTVMNGATLTVEVGATVTVQGSLVNNGTIQGGGTITGNYTYPAS